MNKCRIYLSSPFEYSRADSHWKTETKRILGEHSNSDMLFTAIDPCPDSNMDGQIDDWKKDHDWERIASACSDIIERDLAMLRSCDGMICYMPKDARTFGCTHEIIFALDHRIPVILVAPDGRDSVSRWLWGLLGANRICTYLPTGVEHITRRIRDARGTVA